MSRAFALGAMLALFALGAFALDEVSPTDLKERMDSLVSSKKAQAAKLETAISDHNTTTNLDPFYQDIDAEFRKEILETTKSDRFNDAQFNAYFTQDYLINYNSQLKRRQAALGQYHKILLDGEATLRSNSDIAQVDLAVVNAKLAADGKTKLAWPEDNAKLDAKLSALRLVLENVPERLITMEGLRAKILRKSTPDVAQQEPRVSIPLPPVKPLPPYPTTPPVTVTPNPPPVTTYVVPSITAGDMMGVWVRGDGKVTWIVEQAGLMIIKMSDKDNNGGRWIFDDKTSTMTIRHEGRTMAYSVSRENERLTMLGGGGAVPVRYTKALPRR
ncbi:MAG: hypothetical protein WCT04_11395 [Planctomycetota bacterium]